MKNLYFILITLCFFGGMFLSANAADMSIDMLNKKGKERMGAVTAGRADGPAPPAHAPPTEERPPGEEGGSSAPPLVR